MIADRRLWLDAARERVVEDGDPEAAFLLAAPGDELPADVVERYGLREAKEKRKPEDKAHRRPSAK